MEWSVESGLCLRGLGRDAGAAGARAPALGRVEPHAGDDEDGEGAGMRRQAIILTPVFRFLAGKRFYNIIVLIFKQHSCLQHSSLQHSLAG